MRGGIQEAGEQLRKVHLKGRNEEQIDFVRIEKGRTIVMVVIIRAKRASAIASRPIKKSGEKNIYHREVWTVHELSS